jgi:Flp pilus assembly protein TadG
LTLDSRMPSWKRGTYIVFAVLKFYVETPDRVDKKIRTGCANKSPAPDENKMNLSHQSNRRKRSSRRGNTILELALILTPMFALLLAIVELSLPIFKKSTFQAAVREGVRYGITYQTTYNGTIYGSQTAAIKAVVQTNAMGFLAGTTGSNQIYVKYYLPVSPFTDVTNGTTPNADGNILEVSVQGYTHSWIAPIAWVYGPTHFQVTGTPLSIAASSADRLESLPVGSTRPSP